MFKKVFLLLLSLLAFWLHADEVRPSYLELKENSANQYTVIFKVPARGDKKLSLQVKLPQSCQIMGEKSSGFTGGAYIERWFMRCEGGLSEKVLSVEGLENTNTDLLLRMEMRDGTSQSAMLTPTKRSYKVLKTASSMQVVKTYTWLGITHILMGFDHLMFVFALLLIVKSMRRLLWTITAFTLAHSITLAGATLGYVHVPQAPVEAVIALSILFLAVEIMHEKEGHPGITSRYPWIVAFTFGLLHGFGFAGALSEVGLPEQAVTIALIFFNVGVEMGQLMFVSVVVLMGLILHHLNKPVFLAKAQTLIVYGIGTMSTFWLIERMSSF
ncbi:MAG TPA: HupE/UreJ family protein [Epsilonproteobacteria bacterium]|nr:HupE/UreJ family protein [Campylobacterota bacterium]